jgi:hypothetical protein
MITPVFQLVIGDHLARSVRGVPGAPPGAVLDFTAVIDHDRSKEFPHEHCPRRHARID